VSAHAEAHHGPPIANQSSRVNASILGMLLFIASEIMLFGAFFTAYFFVRVVNGIAWPQPPFELPVFVAGVNTAILVTSSFTMHWALQSIKRGNRAGLQAGLLLTFLMGLVFLVTQAREYSRVGFAPHNGAFGTIFYCLTGLHGAHVFVGLSILLFMTIRAFRGHFSPEHHHGVEIGGIYWHFVDVMWIVVYSTVYLLEMACPAPSGGARPAITRRQSPPSPLPRHSALAANECGPWLGADGPSIHQRNRAAHL
jgi:cytochrome c oxidase subunit 3